jgi:nucleoside-diphosphate-sugar epimerase
MSDGKELHVVFGASGGIGQAVARVLAARGKRVRAVNRSGKADLPKAVEVRQADATDPASAGEACRGATTVYNCAGLPYIEWAAKFPPIMAGLIEAAGAAGANLIFADNLYCYGPVAGPITENLPYRPIGAKGRVRAQLAETLMAAHQSGKVRAAIGRASDYYGPGVVNSFTGADMFRRLLAGKRVMWTGSLDEAHSLSFIEDFARGLVTLGERDEALGQAWHIPCAEALTGRQFLGMAFELASRPAKIGSYSRLFLTAAGLFMPVAREAVEMLYEFEAPFVVDSRKFEKVFGPSPATPHREALGRTIAWFRAQRVSGAPGAV